MEMLDALFTRPAGADGQIFRGITQGVGDFSLFLLFSCAYESMRIIMLHCHCLSSRIKASVRTALP